VNNKTCRQRSLFEILRSYSVHNPLVGYTKGMNQVVSTLLMYIDDDEVTLLGLFFLDAGSSFPTLMDIHPYAGSIFDVEHLDAGL